jgi:hypothetical protein
MDTIKRPAWVEKTLRKYVGNKVIADRPTFKRNVQAEINKIISITDYISKHSVPTTELIRLKEKVQTLLNVINSKQ